MKGGDFPCDFVIGGAVFVSIAVVVGIISAALVVVVATALVGFG